jgi:hypothetical protein
MVQAVHCNKFVKRPSTHQGGFFIAAVSSFAGQQILSIPFVSPFPGSNGSDAKKPFNKKLGTILASSKMN